MTDHTPEPWPDWEDLPGGGSHYALDRYNYERAKACVNACAGIPTEHLELGAIWKLVQAARNTLLPLPPAQARGALQVLRDALVPFRKD